MFDIVFYGNPIDNKSTEVFAFLISPISMTIYISRSGHGKIIRDFALDRYELSGGWIFLGTNKITFKSGSVGKVEYSIRGLVSSSISNKIGRYLRSID